MGNLLVNMVGEVRCTMKDGKVSMSILKKMLYLLEQRLNKVCNKPLERVLLYPEVITPTDKFNCEKINLPKLEFIFQGNLPGEFKLVLINASVGNHCLGSLPSTSILKLSPTLPPTVCSINTTETFTNYVASTKAPPHNSILNWVIE